MPTNSTFTEITTYSKDIFSGLMQDLVIAIVILLVGFVIGKIIGRIIEKTFKAIELDKNITRFSGIKYSMSEVTGAIISYLIYIFAIILALNQLHLTTKILNIIAAIAIAVVIIALLLGIKDFIPNLMAGIAIHNKKHIEKGDYIKVKDVEGKITSINLTETLIQTQSNEFIYMPNSAIMKAEIIKIKKAKKTEKAY